MLCSHFFERVQIVILTNDLIKKHVYESLGIVYLIYDWCLNTILPLSLFLMFLYFFLSLSILLELPSCISNCSKCNKIIRLSPTKPNGNIFSCKTLNKFSQNINTHIHHKLANLFHQMESPFSKFRFAKENRKLSFNVYFHPLDWI